MTAIVYRMDSHEPHTVYELDVFRFSHSGKGK